MQGYDKSSFESINLYSKSKGSTATLPVVTKKNAHQTHYKFQHTVFPCSKYTFLIYFLQKQSVGFGDYVNVDVPHTYAVSVKKFLKTPSNSLQKFVKWFSSSYCNENKTNVICETV